MPSCACCFEIWATCEEDDGCLVEPRGTLNPEGVDLDFADGDQAKGCQGGSLNRHAEAASP